MPHLQPCADKFQGKLWPFSEKLKTTDSHVAQATWLRTIFWPYQSISKGHWELKLTGRHVKGNE